MRSRVLAAALVLLPCASASGQAAAPTPVSSGGVTYGDAVALRATGFSVAPGVVRAGTPVTASVEVSAPTEAVRARIVLRRGGRRVGGLKLGWITAGEKVSRRWTPRVTAGRYTAVLRADDGHGRSLASSPTFPVRVRPARGSAPKPSPAPAPAATATPAPATPAAPAAGTVAGVFPVSGADWTFGGPEARFGAKRAGHIHQGQDVMAPEGTPLVSPVAGVVYYRAVQAAGAGHYLIITGADGRDYAFMHLVAGSELVDKGDTVTAGQAIGQVGSTGDADGSHLHFEIWPDGWYAPDSAPIDPLPDLQRWAG